MYYLVQEMNETKTKKDFKDINGETLEKHKKHTKF